MEKGFLDKLDHNAAIRIWAETTHQEKGDSLAKGYVSELWDFTRISVVQNNLQEMKEIWDIWDDEIKKLLYCNYGDLPYLLNIKVDKHLFRALAQFWNLAYSCFTFGKVDLVPTVEEYTTLLRCPRIQTEKAYSRAKGDSKCIPWKSLRDLILVHPKVNKRVDVFALGIYGLVIFPKALGHIDEAASDLFDRLDKRVTPIPTNLAETFRSLKACRRPGEGRFIGCVQLLLAWIHSHFWKIENISYRGGVRYAPLLVTRQYRWRQFIPATQGLAQCEFSYRSDNYKRKVREMSNAWNQTRQMKILAAGPMMTPEYSWWRSQRVNDNIPVLNQETTRSLEEHLRVMPSELEIFKQDLENRNLELGNKIEQLEEEKMQLRLDVDVQKLEADKLRK
ncbi:hypothetical protein Gotri_000020 [Gossypium trilobum]|uniref:DUF7745 domain-containing protein n=1 Tax=Gossypium trilobum TaxID=34281 RepID=A0A7J9FRF0_9ROSI|nr:hypothetical protein [Gossypium trilobum]